MHTWMSSSFRFRGLISWSSSDRPKLIHSKQSLYLDLPPFSLLKSEYTVLYPTYSATFGHQNHKEKTPTLQNPIKGKEKRKKKTAKEVDEDLRNKWFKVPLEQNILVQFLPQIPKDQFTL